MGYMCLRKLKDVILAKEGKDIDTDKNSKAFAELIQFLDNKSLSLVMRDEILMQHYAGSGKPHIISLYTEMTSLTKAKNECIVIRVETAVAAVLKGASEIISDSLL